jgi:hypothetical protein
VVRHQQSQVLVTRDVRSVLSESEASVGPAQLNLRWDHFPEPVRRHLQYAISVHAPAIRTARLKHDGLFRTSPKQRWLPIDGEQYFSVASPGLGFRVPSSVEVTWILPEGPFSYGRFRVRRSNTT